MADKIMVSTPWLQQSASRLASVEASLRQAAGILGQVNTSESAGGLLNISWSATIGGQGFSGSTVAGTIAALRSAASLTGGGAGQLADAAGKVAALFDETEANIDSRIQGAVTGDPGKDGNGGSGSGWPWKRGNHIPPDLFPWRPNPWKDPPRHIPWDLPHWKPVPWTPTIPPLPRGLPPRLPRPWIPIPPRVPPIPRIPRIPRIPIPPIVPPIPKPRVPRIPIPPIVPPIPKPRVPRIPIPPIVPPIPKPRVPRIPIPPTVPPIPKPRVPRIPIPPIVPPVPPTGPRPTTSPDGRSIFWIAEAGNIAGKVIPAPHTSVVMPRGGVVTDGPYQMTKGPSAPSTGSIRSIKGSSAAGTGRSSTNPYTGINPGVAAIAGI